MAINNGATEDSGTNEAATSRSLEVVVAGSPAVNEKQDSNKSKGDEKVNTSHAPFHKLFSSLLSSLDILLMVVGSIGLSMSNGLSLPFADPIVQERVIDKCSATKVVLVTNRCCKSCVQG
ncbi:hypothetical protein NL676_004089 [Syzygium grande]|nr:hypothetical protein NL676_004089 [Syzygium grande]